MLMRIVIENIVAHAGEFAVEVIVMQEREGNTERGGGEREGE